MRLGKDYIYRDDLFNPKEEGTTVPIQLLVEKFEGIVYNYGSISFNVGPPEEEVPKVKFEYNIIETPNMSMAELRKNHRFNYVLGEVLKSILLDLVELDRGMDENRTDNPEKLDSKGKLY